MFLKFQVPSFMKAQIKGFLQNLNTFNRCSLLGAWQNENSISDTPGFCQEKSRVVPSCFGQTVGCKWRLSCRIDHYFPILLSWTESSPELVGLFGLPCTVSWSCDRPLKSSLHLGFYLLQSKCVKLYCLSALPPTFSLPPSSETTTLKIVFFYLCLLFILH